MVSPLTCSPDIPEQMVGYLELTPAQLKAIQAQVTDECKQVQPLLERLENSRRKLISLKLSGKTDANEIQALAAEESQVIQQLIVGEFSTRNQTVWNVDKRATTKSRWTAARYS